MRKDDIISNQEKNRKFFDRSVWFYETWIVKRINNTLQKRLLKVVEVRDNSKIIDVGCGTGSLLKLLSEEGKNLKLEGMDISGKMIKEARKKIGKNARLFVGRVEDLDVKNKFDYIFTIDSFHHFADQEKVMDNFFNALKKDGQLVILDFSFGRFGNWLFKHFEPGNSKMLLKGEFKGMFERHEFRIVKQRRLGMFSVLTVGERV
ncbi:MAG: methyltransferase domain-containing protein [Nanoarchaeota archaeon]|nr:methyltransferase domain-containing protein [Nanoarchaeota archaeon]